MNKEKHYLEILPQEELVANLKEGLEYFGRLDNVPLLTNSIKAMESLIFNYENERKESCPLCSTCLVCSLCPWFLLFHRSCVSQTTTVNLGYVEDRVRQLRAWVEAYKTVLMEAKCEKSQT